MTRLRKATARQASGEIRTTPVRLNFSTMPVKRQCGSHLGPQLLNIFLAFLLFGCAGSSHPRVITPSEGPPNRQYLELYSDVHAATLHFPAGVYTLNAADKIGYYYRAPRKIAEHAGSGALWREGGIFVSKRNSDKLRGYVFRAGTVTLVANFSGAKHLFRGEDVPAEN